MVVIDLVRTAVVTDAVEALSLRPGRSSVVTDLLVPLELPRFFHQDLPQVQARAATGAFSHLPLTTILHIYTLYMHTATEVTLPGSSKRRAATSCCAREHFGEVLASILRHLQVCLIASVTSCAVTALHTAILALSK